MADMEQTATADSEVQDTPETPDLANPLEPSGLLDDDGDTSNPVDDSEEIDYEGEKYKVPPKLKEAFMRTADYTQKTQGLAEQRRDFEAAQQRFAQSQQLQQRHIQEVAKVISIDERLAQYAQIDFNALTDADPVQAVKLDRQYRELQQQRNQVVQSIEQAQAHIANESSQATARQLQEAAATLSREIKGFGTPEVTKALVATAKSLGYKDEELANITDPRPIRMLNELKTLREIVSKITKEAKQTPEAKPITRITASKGEATRDPAKMSDKEFAAWRTRQIKSRN